MDKQKLEKALKLLRETRSGIGSLLDGVIAAAEDGDSSKVWAKLEALQARRNDLSEALLILIDVFYDADTESWAKRYRK